MKRLLFVLLFTAPLLAQTETRVFPVKYADIRQLQMLLSVFDPAKLSFDENLRVVAVRGSKETVEAIGEAIKRLDVPLIVRDVELNAYLLLASEAPAQVAVPALLDAVVQQLRKLFHYKTYSLLETVIMRVVDGSGPTASGVLPPFDKTVPGQPTYTIGVRRIHVEPSEKDPNIRIEHLAATVKVPFGNATSVTYHEFGFTTDLDIRDGQKVVVGKANVSSAQDALVVVLTAKIVQ